MSGKDNIEELFKETFESFEAPVEPDVWTNIQSRIDSAPSAGGSSSTSGSTGSGIFGGKAAITAFVVAGAMGVGAIGGYLLSKQGSDESADNSNTVAVEQQQGEDAVTPEETVQDQQLINEIEKEKAAQVATESPLVQENESNPSPTQEPQAIQEESTEEERYTGSASSGASNMLSGDPYATQVSSDQTNDSQNGSAQTTSQEQNNTESETFAPASITALEADPVSGPSPLHVSFYLEGDFEKVEWDFDNGNISTDANPVQVFYEEGTYRVNVRAYDAQGGVDERTTEIQVIRGSKLEMPNIITPNSDGVNDVFKPRVIENIDESTYRLVIMNTQGDVLFQTNDPDQGWDGTFQGVRVEKGTYQYHYSALGKDGKGHKKGGRFQLNY